MAMVIGPKATVKDVKKAVRWIVWQELRLKDRGFSDWQSLPAEIDLRNMGLDDVYKKADLHNAIERGLKVHLLCREFEPVQTIAEIVEVVCFKKGIK